MDNSIRTPLAWLKAQRQNDRRAWERESPLGPASRAPEMLVINLGAGATEAKPAAKTDAAPRRSDPKLAAVLLG